MSRPIILDYATHNLVPAYVAPTDVDPGDIWGTEDGGFDVITEDGLFTIEWDNPLEG